MEDFINFVNEMKLNNVDVDSNIAANNYDYDEFDTSNLNACVRGTKLA